VPATHHCVGFVGFFIVFCFHKKIFLLTVSFCRRDISIELDWVVVGIGGHGFHMLGCNSKPSTGKTLDLREAFNW